MVTELPYFTSEETMMNKLTYLKDNREAKKSSWILSMYLYRINHTRLFIQIHPTYSRHILTFLLNMKDIPM